MLVSITARLMALILRIFLPDVTAVIVTVTMLIKYCHTKNLDISRLFEVL